LLAGAMEYLREHMDLRQAPQIGASGGGFIALFGACGVPAEQVVDTAFKLSVEHR
jgi:hypothetical protein